MEITLAGPEVQRLLAEDPTATSKSLLIDVAAMQNLEQRNTNTDRAMLVRVTQAGGGVVLNGSEADVLATALPKVRQMHTSVREVGLFTDPKERETWWVHGGFLVVFSLLLTAEWVSRKRVGLV